MFHNSLLVLIFLGFSVQLNVAFDELLSHEEINYFNESFYETDGASGDGPPTTQPPTTQQSSTEPSEDPTTTTAPTTTSPTSEPLKCETCSVDKIGPYAIKAGEGGCKKTRIGFFTSKYENDMRHAVCLRNTAANKI